MAISNKQKIIFYTQVFYLDAALEYIKLASQAYHLYVFIELTPESTKANIFNLDISLTNYELLTPYSDVSSEWGIENMGNFFRKCSEVNFVIHTHKKSLSLNSFFNSLALAKHFTKISPDHIHFDDLSLRMVGLIPYVATYRKKVIANVHDPKPHSGECNHKKELLKKVFFKLINKYVCFSRHSSNELISILPNKQVITMSLLPYTFYSSYASKIAETTQKITFVGRISKYKGIELFLESVKTVSKLYPEQQFCIAGKLMSNYNPKFENYVMPNLEIIDNHLSNQRLANIIESSSVVVCPYLDATQSGVIMTAYALNRPVIVTPVGGLPEYIINSTNGYVTAEATAKSLANTLIEFIEKRKKTQPININVESFELTNKVKMQQIYS